MAVYVTTWNGPGASTIVLFSWIARLSACPMWCTREPMPALAQHQSSQQRSSTTMMRALLLHSGLAPAWLYLPEDMPVCTIVTVATVGHISSCQGMHAAMSCQQICGALLLCCKGLHPVEMCGWCRKSLVLWCKGRAHTRDVRVVQEELGCRAVLGMLMRPCEALRQDCAIQL